MATRNTDVARPLRPGEYRIQFATTQAEKGWRDLVATARSAAISAWEFLTAHPTETDGMHCYPLRGDLSRVRINGQDHQRWQYKPTESGRIWYAVIPSASQAKKTVGIVLLERVATGHPNETLKQHR
jgi:hypothetical protein